ncbi:MAG: hypothetical protein ACW972_03830 [Promethearchaeota archaeon]|jgi:hypothetical protein
MNLRYLIARLAQIVLIIHGGFQIFGFTSAYLQESYSTMILKFFNLTVFFVSAYLVEYYLKHPHEQIDYNSWSLSKRNF